MAILLTMANEIPPSVILNKQWAINKGNENYEKKITIVLCPI